MNKSTINHNARIVTVMGIMIFVCIAILIRLAYVQLIKGGELTKTALKEMVRSVDIQSERGEIIDRKGKKWAINENAATVWYNPDGVSKEIPKGEKLSEFDKVCDGIAETLELPIGQVRKQLGEATVMIKVGQWISLEQARALREKNFKSISIVDDQKRVYPNGEIAADILGFTNVDHVGLYGVEASYNFDLSGVPGKWTKQTDLFNRQMALSGERKFDPTNGNTIVTTVDETIQSIAHEEAKRAYEDYAAEAISIIVQDPQTGFILGMANYPTFDPNEPRKPRSPSEEAKWAEMSEEQVLEDWYSIWKNYAVSSIYEPGSTFKVITAAAAIEENKSNKDQHYYCSGSIRDIPEVELKCSIWPDGHGDISLRQALEQSCNTTFITVGRHLGARLLYKYVKAFGFGSLTGIDISGESEGIIPASPESMLEVNLATMSYGHGIATTPIQLINGCTAAINGGRLMTPRVIQEIRDQNGEVVKTYEPEMQRQVISESTSRTVLDMMEGVVERGTGKRAQVPGYRIGGKTGTAEKVVDGVYKKGHYVASFFGVAPIENPKFTVLVIIDDPGSGQYYGGATAAPVAQRVMSRTLEYLEVPSAFGSRETSKEPTVVPYVVGMKLEEAGRTLVKSGLRYEVEFNEKNDQATVAGQLIPAGTTVDKGTVVDLSLHYSEETVEEGVKLVVDKTMPSLIGLSKAQALDKLQSLGVQVNVEGEGRVVEQSPGADTPINEGSEITIRCEE
ncbi:MAG: PASTA domain-containing protein [Tissierellia bacterium]|nr:PASTA domain-containing protein [Tissierellia bacterium]